MVIHGEWLSRSFLVICSCHQWRSRQEKERDEEDDEEFDSWVVHGTRTEAGTSYWREVRWFSVGRDIYVIKNTSQILCSYRVDYYLING